jgi:plasmid stabilization system protein ParE
LIFYVPLANGIEVVRVLRGRRDIERIFQEEEDEEEPEEM